jgi:hypothetical protein
MIKPKLEDHPFLNQRDFRDPVLGGMVLAFAVINGILPDSELSHLVSASWHPFLWRSFRSQLRQTSGVLLDGRNVGSLLSSFWNDPITDNPSITIRSSDSDVIDVRVESYCEQELRFPAMLPLVLEGLAKQCDARVKGTIRLQGHAPKSAKPAFNIQGTTTLVCETLDIATDALILHGRIWLEAAAISGPTDRLGLFPKNGGTKVGWGGALRTTFPWSQQKATLGPPDAVEEADELDTLLDECCKRLQSVLTLYADFVPPEDDPDTRWARKSYPALFPGLVRALCGNGIATTALMSAAGNQKIKVHLKKSWPQVRDLLRSGTKEAETIRQAARSAR